MVISRHDVVAGLMLEMGYKEINTVVYSRHDIVACHHSSGFVSTPAQSPKYEQVSKGMHICLMKFLIIMFPVCPIWFQDLILKLIKNVEFEPWS